MDDFFAFLVEEEVLRICLPHSCRKDPPGLGSPEKICNYGDELSQYSLKSECIWVLSLVLVLISMLFFFFFPSVSVLLYTELLSLQY